MAGSLLRQSIPWDGFPHPISPLCRRLQPNKGGIGRRFEAYPSVIQQYKTTLDK